MGLQKKGEKEATPLTVTPPEPAPPNNLWWELDAFVKLVQVCSSTTATFSSPFPLLSPFIISLLSLVGPSSVGPGPITQGRTGVLQEGKQQDDVLTWELMTNVTKVLDAARADAGIVYPADANPKF